MKKSFNFIEIIAYHLPKNLKILLTTFSPSFNNGLLKIKSFMSKKLFSFFEVIVVLAVDNGVGVDVVVFVVVVVDNVVVVVVDVVVDDKVVAVVALLFKLVML